MINTEIHTTGFYDFFTQKILNTSENRVGLKKQQVLGFFSPPPPTQIPPHPHPHTHTRTHTHRRAHAPTQPLTPPRHTR